MEHILPPSLPPCMSRFPTLPPPFPLLCYLLPSHLSFAAPANQQAKERDVGDGLLNVLLSL